MGFLRRSRPDGSATRFFFSTDLHSSEVCFRKLLATPKAYEVETVIMGGDCTGKMLIPLIESGKRPGVYRSEWAGESRDLESPEDVEAEERRIRYSGLYPVRVSEQQADVLRSDSEQLRKLFSERMLATVADWTALARERLEPLGTHMVMTPGNDDEFAVDDVLHLSDYVDAAEGRITEIAGHEMLSVGWSNHTPWDTPRECTEDELAGKIDALAADITDMSQAIFNIHVPPFGTGLDNAPKLDDDLRPVQGGTVMVPVGSTAVREAIERHQPLLALHGHIHESRGVQRIGRTVCVNPGSTYGEGILQGVIIDLERDHVQYRLTDG
jgi:Icc-related predicted phosphoesterase